MRSRILLVAAVVVSALVMPGLDARAQMQWHEVNGSSASVPSLNNPDESDGVEIAVSDGAIIVRTPQKVEVRVFTILGQLVSQATLNAGTSELKISSRGIYIVKIGNLTQKVAL